MRVMKATYDMKCVATLFMFKMRKKRGCIELSVDISRLVCSGIEGI
jgi:hypothetical protein